MDLNQNQRGHGHEVTAEKPAEELEKKKEDRGKNNDPGAPPEHPRAQTERGAQGPSLTAAAEELINNNIRRSTKKTYKSRVNIFVDYCTKQGANTKSCHPNIVINYLTKLAQDRGLSYQTICGYRSAIAKQHIGVGGTPLGMLPEIKRLVRAIFIDSPPLPRYTKCWDVN